MGGERKVNSCDFRNSHEYLPVFHVMSIIQVTGTGKSVATDRTPFYGVRIPTEIKTMIKPLAKLEKNVFRKLLLCEYTIGTEVQFYFASFVSIQ